MTTVPPATTSASGASSTDPTLARSQLGGTFNQFLTLLTTQLKNQDPLSPLDSNQFTSELVQFSGVEQQINANAKLDKLVQQQQSSQVLASANLLGSTIEAKGNAVVLDGVHQGEFGYTLAANAASGTALISDAAGTAIRTIKLDTNAGHHIVSWDGTDDQGLTAPPGTYTVTIDARDPTQQPVAATTSSVGVVSNVSVDNGVVDLSVGSAIFPLSDVLSVTKA